VRERRPLTVLFSELRPAGPVGAGLDPEDLRTLLRRYHRIASRVVRRFDGMLAEYLGDGVVLYFGYPDAREDDADRAVCAGLELIERARAIPFDDGPEVAVELEVRIGVHSGPTFVGDLEPGHPPRATGHTLHLAARLLGAAPADTLVASVETVSALRDAFAIELLGAVHLKGIAAPVRLFRVAKPEIPVGCTGVRVDESPLIARERELGLLDRSFAQACEGRGVALLLEAEPGLGKSRLIRAFRERVADTELRWYESRCAATDRDSAFRSILDLLAQRRAELGGPREPLEVFVGRALELEQMCDVPDAAARDVPRLHGESPLRGASLWGAGSRAAMVRALCRILLELAGERPCVLVVEDLHWADPSSVEVLESLLRELAGVPMFLLLTARPEFSSARQTPLADRRCALGALDRVALERVVRHAARAARLEESLVRELAERADGVPLFAEELGKACAAAADASPSHALGERSRCAIPSSLHGLLMARLDRLEQAKELAQLASVFGREVDERALRALWNDEQSFDGASQRILEARLWIERSDGTGRIYGFRHALIQDAAYESLLLEERRCRHAAIGRYLAGCRPEWVREQPERIALHFERGGVTGSAIQFHRRASDLALRRSAHEEATCHLRRALDLLERLDPSATRDELEIELQVALGSASLRAHGPGSTEVESAFGRARELCGDGSERSGSFAALAGMVIFYQNRSELELALELSETLRASAERSAEADQLLCADYFLGMTRFWRAEFSLAIRHFESSIALYELSRHAALAHVYGTDPGVEAHAYAGLCHWAFARQARARACIDVALELADRLGHPFSSASALGYAAIFHWLAGDYAAAVASSERCVLLSERHRFDKWITIGRSLRLLSLAELDLANTSVGEVTRLLEETRSTWVAEGTLLGAPTLLGAFAELLGRLGAHDAAQAALDQALALAEHLGQHHWDSELFRVQGEQLERSRAEEPGSAEHWMRRAVEAASASGAHVLELRAIRSLCVLCMRGTSKQNPRELLARKLEEISKLDAPAEVGRATELLNALGRAERVDGVEAAGHEDVARQGYARGPGVDAGTGASDRRAR